MNTVLSILKDLNEKQRNRRVKINLGDVKTGRDWLEQYDVTGYIGKSTGTKPIYLMIYNTRSMGGGAILTDSVLKITDTKTKEVLYKAENYQEPNFEIKVNEDPVYTHSLYAYGELQSNHKGEASAKRLLNKLR